MKTCKIQDCNRKHFAKGYCNMHYSRIRNGILDMRPGRIPRIGHPKNRKCSFENCNNKHWQHGYCRLHWSRVERTGNPQLKSKQKNCLIDGCQNKGRFIKGYCRFHYSRFIMGIPLTVDKYATHKGAFNKNWKGGVAEYPNHSLMKRMRKIVLGEENYTCNYCGAYPVKQIHHIDKSRDNHSRENLCACCQSCNLKRGKKKTSKYLRLYGHTLKELKEIQRISTMPIFHKIPKPIQKKKYTQKVPFRITNVSREAFV